MWSAVVIPIGIPYRMFAPVPAQLYAVVQSVFVLLLYTVLLVVQVLYLYYLVLTVLL